MNAGVTEDASKVASNLIDSLKSSPMILALVVFNVLYMVINAYTAVKVAERAERILEKTLDLCAVKEK